MRVVQQLQQAHATRRHMYCGLGCKLILDSRYQSYHGRVDSRKQAILGCARNRLPACRLPACVPFAI
jgi:hypothetical protein